MGRAMDLTGFRSGSLVAIEKTEKRTTNGGIIWLCHCDCGNKEVYIEATELKNGRVKYCKLCSPNKDMFEKNRYTKRGTTKLYKIGDKVHHFTIEDIYLNEGTYKKISYLCSCDCGNPNKIIVKHTHLKGSAVTSCGCEAVKSAIRNGKKAIKVTDITGQRYEKLVALYTLDKDMKATAPWVFQCDCGNTHIMKANDFLRGRASSCGCIISKGEYLIAKKLKELNISFKQQVSFKGLTGLNGGLLRYDFGIYNKNNELLFLLEYDGYYHFYATDLEYKNINVHISTVEHDKRKTDYCKKYKIPLYRIDDQKKINKEINKLLKLYSLL